MQRLLASIVLVCLALPAAAADIEPLDSRTALSPQTWDLLRARMRLLNNISYLPSLLPVIMNNRDSLELTPEQMTAFRDWRRKNYQAMVDKMNTIIEKRILLSQHAVRPETGPEELIAMQDEIFELQREVFRIRLSCRQLITRTFTEEQWSNFAFIAADDPQIAGLFAQ